MADIENAACSPDDFADMIRRAAQPMNVDAVACATEEVTLARKLREALGHHDLLIAPPAETPTERFPPTIMTPSGFCPGAE